MALIDKPAAPYAADPTLAPAAIDVRNVHKAFGSQIVLDDVSLSVAKGETLAVLGRSGTGKSVLLRLIIALEQPDSGSVHIQGADLAELSTNSLSEVRQHIGFLFQQAALYDSLTVGENVAFPLEHYKSGLSASALKERVDHLLEEVGLDGHSGKMPSDISGGMQKRVGLARALALSPEILLLDEPTAGLDPISSAEIGDLILKLQKEHQMASIVVTHDMVSAKTIADRLILLNAGKVVIEGTYQHLQQSDDVFVVEFLKYA